MEDSCIIPKRSAICQLFCFYCRFLMLKYFEMQLSTFQTNSSYEKAPDPKFKRRFFKSPSQSIVVGVNKFIKLIFQIRLCIIEYVINACNNLKSKLTQYCSCCIGQERFFSQDWSWQLFYAFVFQPKSRDVAFWQGRVPSAPSPPRQGSQGCLPPKTRSGLLLFDDVTKEIWDHTK